MRPLIRPGKRVQIVSDRPRYNGRTGTITSVNIAYTVALDEIVNDDRQPVLEVRAREAQVRAID